MNRPTVTLRRTIFAVTALLVSLSGFMRGQTATVTTRARLGGEPDGYHPKTGLVDGGEGFFYGTTEAGGPTNLGTIYKLAPDNTFYGTTKRVDPPATAPSFASRRTGR